MLVLVVVDSSGCWLFFVVIVVGGISFWFLDVGGSGCW